MFNARKTIMAITVTGLVLVSYGGEFTLKKADHEMLLKKRILGWEMGASSLQEILPQSKVKVPDGLVEPKLKTFNSGTALTTIQLLVYKSSTEAKTFDRVIVDQAGNSDFADDPVLTFGPDLPVDVKLQLKGRDMADYRIYLVSTPTKDGSGWDVALLPILWREGTITLAGKPVRALMLRSGQTLIIDFDGDGQLNPSQYSDWVQVATYVKTANTFYKTVLGASENELDFEPFNGPFGKLEVTGEMVTQGNYKRVSLVLGGSEGAEKMLPFDIAVEVANTNHPIIIPAGKYSICTGRGVIDQGKNRKYVSFKVENKVVIHPDQVTTLNLGQPKPDLSLVQQGRKLRITLVMAFAGNLAVTYSMVPEGESKDKVLTVDVVDASDPAKVIVGRTNMEYG